MVLNHLWNISSVVDFKDSEFKKKLIHASLGVHLIWKNQYNFTEDEQAAAEYEAFLRKQLYSLEPAYYGVAEHEVLDTADGLMCRLRVIWTLNNPEIEIIAECKINNQFIYLWRDVVWAVSMTRMPNMMSIDAINRSFVHYDDCDRMFGHLTIYPIGQLPSWMHL